MQASCVWVVWLAPVAPFELSLQRLGFSVPNVAAIVGSAVWMVALGQAPDLLGALDETGVLRH